MPKADYDHTTSSRRNLLARSTAPLLAGAAAATVARTAPLPAPVAAGDDAELIRLYRAFLAVDIQAWNADTVACMVRRLTKVFGNSPPAYAWCVKFTADAANLTDPAMAALSNPERLPRIRWAFRP